MTTASFESRRSTADLMVLRAMRSATESEKTKKWKFTGGSQAFKIKFLPLYASLRSMWRDSSLMMYNGTSLVDSADEMKVAISWARFDFPDEGRPHIIIKGMIFTSPTSDLQNYDSSTAAKVENGSDSCQKCQASASSSRASANTCADCGSTSWDLPLYDLCDSMILQLRTLHTGTKLLVHRTNDGEHEWVHW